MAVRRKARANCLLNSSLSGRCSHACESEQVNVLPAGVLIVEQSATDRASPTVVCRFAKQQKTLKISHKIEKAAWFPSRLFLLLLLYCVVLLSYCLREASEDYFFFAAAFFAGAAFFAAAFFAAAFFLAIALILNLE